MRRGAFEERESEGGKKYYQLRWESRQSSLSSQEVLAGLFIRYLISRGKLSEFSVPAQLSSGQDDDSGKTKSRGVDK